MPLSELDKQQLVQQMGEDPSQFTIDDTGSNLIPKPRKIQPTVGADTVPKFGELLPLGDSPLTTAGKSFLQEAPSALGAGLLASGGMALGGALAPPTGGLSLLIPLLLGGAGGYIGGKLTKKLQNAVEPESMTRNVEESQRENPKAGAVGNIASLIAGGFNPNPLRTVKALGTAGKLIGSVGDTAVADAGELGNLLNVGVGAGMGAGTSAIEGGDIKDIVGSAAVGSLFNTPNRLGKRIGFHDAQPFDLDQHLQGTMVPNSEASTIVPPQTELTPDQKAAAGGMPITRRSTIDGPLSTMDVRSDKMARYRDSKRVPEEDLSRFEGEGGPVRDTEEEAKGADFLLAKEQLRLENEKKKAADVARQEADALAVENEKKQSQLSMRLGQEGSPTKIMERGIQGEQRPPADYYEATPEGNKPIHIEEINKGKLPRVSDEESANDLEARRIEAELSGEERPRYSTESDLQSPTPVRTKFQEEQLPTLKKYSPTKEWFKRLSDFGSTFRGIKTDLEGNPVDVVTGKPVAGETILRKGLGQAAVKIGSKAGADTVPHEFLHVLFNDLQNSKRPGDVRVMDKYYKVIKESPDYERWKQERIQRGQDGSPEEYAATNGGYEFIRQHLNTDKESSLGRWFNDFKSYVKTRYSEHATPEDYQRLLNYRLKNDKPFTGEGVNANATVGTHNQDNSELRPDMDSARRVSEMSSDEFRQKGKSFNKVNLELAKNLTPDDVKELHQLHSKAVSDYKAATDKAFSEGATPQDMEDMLTKAQKPQFFSEALREYYHPTVDGKFDKYTKHSTESELPPQEKLHAMNDAIPIALDTVIKEIKDDTMSEEGAANMKKTFIEAINWQGHDPVFKQALATDFESLPQVNALKEAFLKLSPPIKTEVPRTIPEKALEANKPVVKTPPAEMHEPKVAKQTKATMPKEPIGSVRLDQEPTKAPKKLDEASFKITPLTDDEQMLRHAQIKKEWQEVDNAVKGEPSADAAKQLAERMRGDYQKAYDTVNQMRAEGMTGDRKFDTAVNRMTSLRMMYQHLIDKRGIREPEIGPLHSTESFLPSFIQPEVSKIANIDHPKAKEVSEAFSNFYDNWRQYAGKFQNDIVGKLGKHINWFNPKELFTQNNDKMKNVVNYLWDMQDSGASKISLSTEENQILKAVRDNMKITLDEKNSFPTLRKTIKGDPNYLPQIPSRKTLDTLLNHSGSPEAKTMWDKWDDYYLNTLHKTQAEADEAAKIFKGAYLKQKSDLSSQFGPIDKAAGLGLPREWREGNLMDIMGRFTSRYGRRLAYHKAVETNKDVMDALYDPRTGMAANDSVKNVLENIQGVTEHEEAKRTAFSGIVRAGMLGPLTGAKDFTSNLTLGFQHFTPKQALVSALDAWKNMSQSIEGSFKTGVNRHNIGALEFGEGGIEDLTNMLRRSRDVLNTVQGRNFLEKMSRATAFGQGRFVALDNIASFNRGKMNGTKTKFMDDFAPKDWRTIKEWTPDIVDEIAAKYVESVQGTYNYKGLPSIAQKGTLAPFLALNRWNIEKMNNFNKMVVQPAREGNFTPLLMSTIGMIIGGEAVNKLVETATGRKEKTPKLEEIAASDEKVKGATYKLAGLASLSGYAGMLGDLAKSGMDLEFKNSTQSFSNPLITGIETVGRNVGNVIETLQHGNLDITGDAISQFLEDSLQVYRLGLAHLSSEKKEDIEKNNKYRDLRMFKNLNNMPVSDITTDRPNPFMDKDIKDYKKTEDFGKVADLLPKLIEKAFDNAAGDPERLELEFKKIKQNNYQTMPSPEHMPISFAKYLQYVADSQGADKATDLVMDYFRKNAINSIKSDLIPSL
jgi:hypothetical protein